MIRRTAAAALGAVAAATLGASAAQQPAGCDLLIAGGRVVDGTGRPWFARGRLPDRRPHRRRPGARGPRGQRRIDATGLVVAPGFIDMLGQSESWVLRDNRVASKIMQGITTELTGEASFTSAATRRTAAASLRRDVRREQVRRASTTSPATCASSTRSRRPSTSAPSSAPAACATR